MRRPSFQFYPADWRNNANLRRCSWAARGVWVEIMGLMHDSDDYGLLHWSLKEIAQALGCPVSLVKELASKDVLKGCDAGQCESLIYVPRSGRKDGEPVTLIPEQSGPIWYSSRMVKDEYVRTVRGENSRFGDNKGDTPKPSPKPYKGDGSTSSSSPSGKPNQKETPSTTEPSEGGMGSSSPTSRTLQIIQLLTRLETARGKTLAPVVTSDKVLAAWVEAGVTDSQIEEAHGLAAAKRQKDDDSAPVNIGFLDVFVAKVVNPKEGGSAVTAAPEEKRGPPICCCCDREGTLRIGTEWFCGRHDQGSARKVA